MRRHEAEARIQIIEEQMLVRNQDQQREGLKAIDLEVTSLTDERKQINSLRKELQLESLPI
ncbi:MAG: hypothetical protein HWD61_02300 [Parachlamydiaceae bacterium]|nr:MAG: hypothetical protein HWD61_02300 [Parachlamydiaceae bacterium]